MVLNVNKKNLKHVSGFLHFKKNKKLRIGSVLTAELTIFLLYVYRVQSTHIHQTKKILLIFY